MKELTHEERRLRLRGLAFGLVLVVVGAIAFAARNWNRLVQLPNPRAVIRTDAEAVAGAREFLATAEIGTGGYDLTRPSEVTKSRLKGEDCWRIVWSPKPDSKATNKLSVLADPIGSFSTFEEFDSDHGMAVSGIKTNQSNFRIRRSPYTIERRRE